MVFLSSLTVLRITAAGLNQLERPVFDRVQDRICIRQIGKSYLSGAIRAAA
jgi:hypothetical protein